MGLTIVQKDQEAFFASDTSNYSDGSAIVYLQASLAVFVYYSDSKANLSSADLSP